jgi:hypothetical protein
MRLTFLLFFLSLLEICSAQNLELGYALHYQTEDVNGFESILRVSNGTGGIVVNGLFQPNCIISITGDSLLETNTASTSGATIFYENDVPVEYYILGSIIFFSKRLSDGRNYTVGGFSEQTDFDLSNTLPLNIIPNGLANIYTAEHFSDGSIGAVNYGDFSVGDIASFDGGFLVVGDYYNDCLMISLEDTTVINENGGDVNSDGISFLFDSNNALVNYKAFAPLGNNLNRGCDYFEPSSELTVCGRATGSFDYQWEGVQPFVVNHLGEAAFLVSYNETLELSSLLLIINQENEPLDHCEFTSNSYDGNGNLYVSGIIEQGNYTFKLNDHEEDFIVTNPMELVMIKLSADKELQWIRRMPVGDFSLINRIDIDHNGFINACGYYNTSISFEGTNISYTDGGDYSGFIARWTPEGELVWAHTIYDSAGDNEIKDICITPQNYMYIGGYFTSFSTDFDFTEGQYDLGITNGEDAFLAKYTIANPTPDIFVEQGWQTTEVSEAGTEDAIYIRLSHIPTAAVQVTATPDAQLDLGNGAGNSITLTFGADSTAIQQQTINVAAFNDTAVEGPHNGQITFSINSTDAAFDVLTEDAITVNITDNDVINIEENAALKFSVSPNPVKDELNIIFTPKRMVHNKKSTHPTCRQVDIHWC